MSSSRIWRYTIFALYLYVVIFQVFVEHFLLSFVCLYLCFVCLMKNEKSDMIMNEKNGAVLCNFTAACTHLIYFHKQWLSFFLITYNG